MCQRAAKVARFEMWGRGVSLWVMLVGFCAVGRVTGNEHNHQYAIGDMTTLWVNKVGPYNNPQETYQYFDLPFCRPDGALALASSLSLSCQWAL